ncbi:MAG TPA: hypothetical protein VJU59_23575 [Paraburkholderia sp.]|uniref:hypothetical protein n=1 Tax=Paraburkholderia sp. TaxID=1926495 RepID=UPI002B48DC91|nr:hypothetical protein [Paraburkholderia sp.]HKR42616.1 hypothetical protein [Paraburkholderia sp.]
MNAKEYLTRITPAAQRSSLSPYHADILELRAAGCTLAQITEFLRLNNVNVTWSAVGRYLRKHNDAAGASCAPADASGEPAGNQPSRPAGSSDTAASVATSSNPTGKEPPGFKSVDELRAEHPTMPRSQLNRLYAQQYDRPPFTAADLEELKRKYPPPLVRSPST